METHYVSCEKNTVNENWSVRKTKQNRLMLSSNCTVCDKKNQLLLKIKNFQMISLNWIESLTNFYWLETDLCQNCI